MICPGRRDRTELPTTGIRGALKFFLQPAWRSEYFRPPTWFIKGMSRADLVTFRIRSNSVPFPRPKAKAITLSGSFLAAAPQQGASRTGLVTRSCHPPSLQPRALDRGTFRARLARRSLRVAPILLAG